VLWLDFGAVWLILLVLTFVGFSVARRLGDLWVLGFLLFCGCFVSVGLMVCGLAVVFLVLGGLIVLGFWVVLLI